MKEITILSGKGGTGKTSISAGLASLAKNAVICDSDVDASDLFLILKPKIVERHIFPGAWIASIDASTCTSCGICKNYCRFDAIYYKEFGGFEINPFQCEGCRLCERICPAQAITCERSLNNHWYVSSTRLGMFVHAEMGPGEENSGKLVTLVRNRSRSLATELKADYIINDGPPGIGCPVISSLAGTDIVLAVVEPSQSGLHDASRLFELTRSFHVPTYAVINKCNINKEMTDAISDLLHEKNIPLLAELPFDKKIVEAMIDEKTILEYAPKSDFSKALETVWGFLNS